MALKARKTAWLSLVLGIGLLGCSNGPPDVGISWDVGWEEGEDVGRYVVTGTITNNSNHAIHEAQLYVKVGGVVNADGEIVSFPSGQGELRVVTLGTLGAGDGRSFRAEMLEHANLDDARRVTSGSPDPVPVALQVVAKEGRSEKVWGRRNSGAPVPPWLNKVE